MEGKVCLITGATSGIGKAAAMQLAQLGATVVLGARDPGKAAEAAAQIRQYTGNDNIDYLLADLSSQQEVRRLADEFKTNHHRLDVLVNNAGSLMLTRQESVDRIEMTFALNHLNYFLLTNLLLDRLQASAPSRVVNVSSDAHRGARINFSNPQFRPHSGGDAPQGAHGGSYGGYRAYGQSKLANLLFTYELARRLEGTGVTANGIHPGLVASGFLATNNGMRGRVFNFLFRLVARSTSKGARTVTYLANSPEVAGVTGKYFIDEEMVLSSQTSYDTEAAKQLWELSEELTKLRPAGSAEQATERAAEPEESREDDE